MSRVIIATQFIVTISFYYLEIDDINTTKITSLKTLFQ